MIHCFKTGFVKFCILIFVKVLLSSHFVRCFHFKVSELFQPNKGSSDKATVHFECSHFKNAFVRRNIISYDVYSVMWFVGRRTQGRYW